MNFKVSHKCPTDSALASQITALSKQVSDLQTSVNNLTQLVQGEQKQMAGILDSVTAAQASEHADIATLGGLVQQLLTAFASGAITPAQAQTLADAITADDATAKSSITAIQAALTPAPAQTA